MEGLSVGGSTFDEDAVVWSLLFWAVRETSDVAPVVAETAMTRPQNRKATASFIAALGLPTVEVLLAAPQEALLPRYCARLADEKQHRIYRQFPPGNGGRASSKALRAAAGPVPGHRSRAADPARIDVSAVAAAIQSLVAADSGRSQWEPAKPKCRPMPTGGDRVGITSTNQAGQTVDDGVDVVDSAAVQQLVDECGDSIGPPSVCVVELGG